MKNYDFYICICYNKIYKTPIKIKGRGYYERTRIYNRKSKFI